MTDGKNGLTYSEAGVDIDAGNALVERIKPAAKRTARSGVMSGLGGFGALFDLKDAGFSDPVLVAATDGVGTKLKIAIETGQHATVGIDLVAMCVNDLICQGAEPLFFLDYFATGALDVDAAATVVEGIAEGCVRTGCALIGQEGRDRLIAHGPITNNRDHARLLKRCAHFLALNRDAFIDLAGDAPIGGEPHEDGLA